METDYRKLFESPTSGGTLGQVPGLRTVDTATSTPAPPSPDSPAVVGAIAPEDDPSAVTFPQKWFVRLVYYAAVAGGFGFVAHTAFTGDPDRDLWKILIGCAGVLAVLCFLPGSILLDRRGVHQVYCMGLWEYSIPRNSILSYQQSTRAELRREGKLWFSWNRHNHDRDDEHEDVVIVRGKYGGRYILHAGSHRGHYTFVEELEKRGVPAHGYEGWANFMADRGFPPVEDKPSA